MSSICQIDRLCEVFTIIDALTSQMWKCVNNRNQANELNTLIHQNWFLIFFALKFLFYVILIKIIVQFFRVYIFKKTEYKTWCHFLQVFHPFLIFSCFSDLQDFAKSLLVAWERKKMISLKVGKSWRNGTYIKNFRLKSFILLLKIILGLTFKLLQIWNM